MPWFVLFLPGIPQNSSRGVKYHANVVIINFIIRRFVVCFSASRRMIRSELTVKDEKACSNSKLSNKSPFTKTVIPSTVDYCFLKTSFIIFVNFGGVP